MIETLRLGVAAALAAGAALGCLYALVCMGAVLLFPRRRIAPETQAEPLTVLVPLHGDAAGLAERLEALSAQSYESPVQIVCGVQDVADPAAEVVRAFAAEHTEAEISILADARTHGLNGKISNLANIAPLARYSRIALIDGDIVCPKDHLARVVGGFTPGVGAVTALYHGVVAGGVWAALSSLAIDAHFLPSAILASRFRLAHPCCGATIALSSETLKRVGGLEAFADTLEDDYALGAAVRGLGLEVAVSSSVVGHVCADRTLSELFRRLLRSAQTIQRVDPMGHAGSVLTHPLPLSLLAWAGGQPHAPALAVAALATRFGLYACVAHVFPIQRQPLWRLAAVDGLAFAVYLVSFLSRDIYWRGERYRVGPDGRLVSEAE